MTAFLHGDTNISFPSDKSNFFCHDNELPVDAEEGMSGRKGFVHVGHR